MKHLNIFTDFTENNPKSRYVQIKEPSKIPYTLQIRCKYGRLFAVDVRIPKLYHAQSCCFSPKNQAEQLSCPDSARTWAELALQDPRRNASWTPTAAPQKDNVIKSQCPKDILVGKSSSDKDVSWGLPSPVVNAQAPKWSFTSRDCSTDCNLGVKHPVPGPGTYELSPSENAAKTLAESQGKWQKSNWLTSCWYEHIWNRKNRREKSSLWYLPRFLGGWDSFFWPSMFIFIKESNINYIPYMNIMNGYIYIDVYSFHPLDHQSFLKKHPARPRTFRRPPKFSFGSAGRNLVGVRPLWQAGPWGPWGPGGVPKLGISWHFPWRTWQSFPHLHDTVWLFMFTHRYAR